MRGITNKTVDDRLSAEQRSLTRMANVINVITPILWQCKICSHVWEATPNNVLNVKSGCPVCAIEKSKLTNILVDARLTDSNRHIKRRDEVVGSLTSIDWECGKCNHTWKATPNSVLNMGTGCPVCAVLTNNTVDTRLTEHDRPVKRVGDVEGMHAPVEWKCEVCTHMWVATPDNVLNKGTGCPECQCSGMYCESYFRANPKKKIYPALVYLVEGETNGIKFFKVGITKKNTAQRYAGNKTKYNIVELASTHMMLYDAFSMEQEILCKYKEFLVRPDEDFGGKTECFQYNPAILTNILRDYFNRRPSDQIVV